MLRRPMLETLTKGFTAARERLAGVRELSAENVSESLRDVRMSLLEADVDLGVVREFLARVQERVLGEKVETLAVTLSRPLAARRTSCASSAMPRTSASVSLGRPIMK